MGPPSRILGGGGSNQCGRFLLQWTLNPNPIPRSRIRIAMRRTFSASTAHRKLKSSQLPTFPPTSSPELDSLLNHLREELFIPTHLLKHHRNLMYRQRNHHVLLEEPVYFNIDGQTVHITPKDRVPPLPLSLFTQALQLVQTPKDFEILPDLILGFTQANRPLKQFHIEKMIRRLSLAGHIDLLWSHFAPQASELGLNLTLPIYREISRGLTIHSNLPHKYDSNKALRRASQLPSLIQSFAPTKDHETRLLNDPVVNGTIAGMYAQTRLTHHNGLDLNGTVLDSLKNFLPGYEEMALMEWDPPLFKSRPSFETIKQLVLDYSFLHSGLLKVLEVLRNTQKLLDTDLRSMASAGADRSAKEERFKWLIERTPWLSRELIKLEKKLDEWKGFLEENKGFLEDPAAEHLGMELYARVTEKLAKERESERAVWRELKEEAEEAPPKS